MSNRICHQPSSNRRIPSKKLTLRIEDHEASEVGLAVPLCRVEVPECRICIEGGDLIRPCKCSGSAAYTHPECLKLWIMKKSEDKDGVVRHLQDVKCEMCKCRYQYHSSTITTYSCQMLSKGCRSDLILELFFTVVFLTGAFVCGIVYFACVSGKSPAKEETSIIGTCLIVSVPVCLIVGVSLLVSFVRSYLVDKSKIIVKIDEYVPPDSAGEVREVRSSRSRAVSINIQQ